MGPPDEREGPFLENYKRENKMSNPENATNEPKWVSNFHFVLTNQTNSAVLMLSNADKWALPHLRIEGGVWIGETDKLVAVIREQLGLTMDFTILRYASLNCQ